MEQGKRGAVTAKKLSGVGLEMHLVVGLLNGVLLKYFSFFGFIKNKTQKTCCFFEYRECCLYTTAGLIWEEGGLVLRKVVGEQLFYSGHAECICSTAKCKVKHLLYLMQWSPCLSKEAIRFIIIDVLMLFCHLIMWGGDHQLLYSCLHANCWITDIWEKKMHSRKHFKDKTDFWNLGGGSYADIIKKVISP